MSGFGIFKIFLLFEFLFLVLSFYKFCCKYHSLLKMVKIVNVLSGHEGLKTTVPAGQKKCVPRALRHGLPEELPTRNEVLGGWSFILSRIKRWWTKKIVPCFPLRYPEKIFLNHIFLDTSSHFHKRLPYLSVHRSIGPSVRRSIGPSVSR